MQSPPGPIEVTAWSPFRYPAFAVLWVATVIGNVGVWMYNAGAGWLMTTLDSDPLMVSLVQVSTLLPMFVFALPAGALADIIDRRRWLLAVQALVLAASGGLGALVLAGLVTPWLLLGFTFAAGLGAALTAPAWQAVVPQLVPREQLQSAVALNSVGVNLSRAVGPALVGGVILAGGLAAPFFLHAISLVGVLAALLWWRPPSRPPSELPAERFAGAIRAGLRHARRNRALRATLLRASGFFVFASAYWALLPLIAREQIGGGPQLYGLLLGAIGAAAVVGALLLPRLRARFGAERVVTAGGVATALAMAMYALAREPWLAFAASVLAGIGWIGVLAVINVSAQLSLPDWVRARGLAIFVTTFTGALAAGSIIWGQLAGAIGVPGALLAAAAGLAVTVPLSRRWRLQSGAGADLSPSMHWPAPVAEGKVDHDRGPVMVTVEYLIDPARRDGFLAALRELEQGRRRDGAYAWFVFEDVARPGLFVEAFMVESWLEHLRQHERVTIADRDLQAAVRGFYLQPPRIRHLLAPKPDRPRPDDRR